MPDRTCSAALSPNGRRIVAVGHDAIARYQKGQWTVDPARNLAADAVRFLISMGDGAGWLALTTRGMLLRLGDSGGFTPWGPSLDRFSFSAAVAISEGFLLVGGSTTGKRRGVVAKLVGESLTIVAADLAVGALLAATQLADGSTLAVGERGHIARIRGGSVIESARPCDVDLLATCAVTSSRDGAAAQEILATGLGAWAFRVTIEPLTEVEAVDTLSALSCLALDEQGNAWAGSNKGRILRRRDRHWRRMNPSFADDPAVLAIHASTRCMRAVLADGHVVIGRPTT